MPVIGLQQESAPGSDVAEPGQQVVDLLGRGDRWCDGQLGQDCGAVGVVVPGGHDGGPL
jgi:hypothetical protein